MEARKRGQYEPPARAPDVVARDLRKSHTVKEPFPLWQFLRIMQLRLEQECPKHIFGSCR